MRIWIRFLFVSLLALLAACSDDSSSASVSPGEEDSYSSEVESSSSKQSSSSIASKSSSSTEKSSSGTQKSSSSETKASSSSYFKENWNYLNPDISYGEMTDSRDGQIYKTVVIGSQKWMAENLNFETENSACYMDSLEYCKKYGRLYTWTAAMDSACPEGWHLPDLDEWEQIVYMTDDQLKWGKMYKATKGWSDECNGTDDYGLSILPAGASLSLGYKDGFSKFWMSLESYEGQAYEIYFACNSYSVGDSRIDQKISVRCISDDTIAVSSSSADSGSSCEPTLTLCKTETEDNCEYGSVTDNRDGLVYKTVKLACKWWMAENLKFDAEDSFEGNHGRLYKWSALEEACPSGWHVSTVDEWQDLINRVHKEFGNNAVLRSTTGWDVDSSRIDDEEWGGNVKGTDGLGFSVFPDGSVYYSERKLQHEGVGSDAFFWTVEYFQSDRDVVNFSQYEIEFLDSTSPYAYSVRCVKD